MDLPDDIMNDAKRTAETVCRNLDYDDVEIEVREIAWAIYRERLRCQKIAWDQAENEEYGHAKHACITIAQAINS